MFSKMLFLAVMLFQLILMCAAYWSKLAIETLIMNLACLIFACTLYLGSCIEKGTT